MQFIMLTDKGHQSIAISNAELLLTEGKKTLGICLTRYYYTYNVIIIHVYVISDFTLLCFVLKLAVFRKHLF